MDNARPKRKTGKIIALVVIILIASVAAWYYLLPVQVLPKKYSGMSCHYVRINGQMYEPKDGFPTDEQVSKIEEILKKYTMKHTTKPFADDGLYGFEKLYMVFSFTDERGYITDSRGINIDKDMTASTRVRPFLDSLAVIDDGETLYKEVMEVLGLTP